MYLRNCLIENVGPLELVDLSLPFNEDATPKPLVLVGRNGSGKSVLLSHVVDALIEFAKTAYRDMLVGQEYVRTPYFKTVGGSNQRTGTKFGVALLGFSDGESVHSYVDKSGTLDYSSYASKMADRFPSVAPWPQEGNHKAATMPADYARRFFKEAAVCYFPSTRHERPHWLNPESVKDDPIFYFAENFSDRLYKPVIVESAAQENKQWLLDVMLDALMDVQPVLEGDPPQVRYQVTGNLAEHMLLRQSRASVEAVLKGVLQDETAGLRLNFRTVAPYRLSVQLADDRIIPSLDHLSSGQANLLNLFLTIIRYADRGDLNKSYLLQEIKGIVLIDEIEAQAHSDLQYEVLPKLLKMFPKVQFVLTSHSPLFLLGMEKIYGSEGFQIVEMPTGQSITTERFSEFKRSWEYYRRTTAYERDLEDALVTTSKPLVFTEGETDPIYIMTALEVLKRSDLLDALDIQWVGTQSQQGPTNTGDKALNNVAKLLKANTELTNRRVLLLYDCDSSKPVEDTARVSVRSLSKNEANSKAKKGIENLLPANIFEQRFYLSRELFGDYGERKIIQEFDKTAFCQWVCKERKQASDFERFDSVVSFLEEFLASPNVADR